MAAAGLAFSIRKGEAKETKSVIVDMNPGGVEVCLMTAKGDKCTIVNNVSDSEIGMNCIVKTLVDKLQQELHVDSNNLSSLTNQCEKAVQSLYREDGADIELLISNEPVKRHVSKQEFNELSSPIVEKALDMIHGVFDGTEVDPSDVSRVLVIGEGTLSPQFRQGITEFLSGDIVELTEFVTAEGASLQGGSAKNGVQGPKMQDCLSLSLGISLANGTTSVILPRGTPLPAKHEQITTTYRDNQSNVGFDVVEGERPMACDNIKLGHVLITGIQKAKKMIPRILIQMLVDEDGILTVHAKDQNTGTEVSTQIRRTANLSRETIDQMIKEAEDQKDDDTIRMSQAQAKTSLRFFIDAAKRETENACDRNKITEDDKVSCEQEIAQCEEWMDSHNDESPEVYQEQQTKLRDILHSVMGLRL